MCAAQASVIAGKELASHYVHAGMIGLDGEKMSKSKGNLVFVSKLVAAGRDPMAIRWALMKNHYTSDRMWTEHCLLDAEEDIASLRKTIASANCAPTHTLIQNLIDLLADDLDTPAALAAINHWVKESQQSNAQEDPAPLLVALDALLGLKL